MNLGDIEVGGEDPFSYFDNQQEFIDFFTQDKNLIVRERGPGDAVGEGEWYLTKAGMEHGLYFLSRVRLPNIGLSPNPVIDFLRLRSQRILSPWKRGTTWSSGYRDSWSPACTHHWKVDFDDILKMQQGSFMNWSDENPLEVKG